MLFQAGVRMKYARSRASPRSSLRAWTPSRSLVAGRVTPPEEAALRAAEDARLAVRGLDFVRRAEGVDAAAILPPVTWSTGIFKCSPAAMPRKAERVAAAHEDAPAATMPYDGARVP